MIGPTAPRSLLLLLFFLSGAAALVYEVLWLKQLGLLFGVTAYAAATTLAIFFLGLATGSLVWGRRVASDPRPLRTYALLELGIAVSAVLYFGLVDLYRGLYPHLFARFGDTPSLFLLVKLSLATGVLFLPAFLMGGTLPVMGQYLVRRASELGRTASALYAVNTLGAAFGALAAGVLLPAWLGFRLSYLVAMATNLLVAAVAGWWSAREPVLDLAAEVACETDGSGEAGTAVLPQPSQSGGLDDRLIALLAFASGFLTLALEVLWTRMFAQVLQNSVYTFAMILTVFLVALALGSLLAHLLCRRTAPVGTSLQVLLVSAGLLVGLSPLLFQRLTRGLDYYGSELGWSAYLVAVLGVTAAVLLPPVVAAGSVFPYLMKLSEDRMRSAGRTIGRLASINTFAAILGSLAAGFLLLNWIGLWGSLRLAAAAYLALAILMGWRAGSRPAQVLGAVAVAGVLGLAFLPAYARLPLVSLDPDAGERLVAVWEGASGTVAVVDRSGDRRLKLNNSYPLGGSQAAVNERVQAWLPLGLHPRPRALFFLGLGTGITAGAALDFPVERVTVCEINPDVVRASREHFAPWTNGLFQDPRVRVVVEDGRNFLLGTPERYDLVIGDIFLTYRAGVGTLYTREHFAAIAERLEPGGLFVQWLTMFDLTAAEFGTIARALLDVFPQVTLWRRSVSPQFPVFALVAQKREAPLRLEMLTGNLARLARPGKLPPEVWLHNIPLSAYVGNLSAQRASFDAYPLSTDDTLPLEYSAPRTERNSRGAGTTPVLARLELARFCEGLLAASPVAQDPYLARIGPTERRQVAAGLAYYRYTTLRGLGRDREAERALAEYRVLIAPP